MKNPNMHLVFLQKRNLKHPVSRDYQITFGKNAPSCEPVTAVTVQWALLLIFSLISNRVYSKSEHKSRELKQRVLESAKKKSRGLATFLVNYFWWAKDMKSQNGLN